MPKIGPLKMPNNGLEKVAGLIEEVGQRVNVSKGNISEETFQNEYLQKAGGTYNAYRYDMDLYGFINRPKGTDSIQITELFVNVADPLKPEEREEAKSEAARNVPLFKKMFRSNLGQNVSEDNLRIWLVEEQNISRGNIEQKKLDSLQKLYNQAYPYLEMSMEPKIQEKKEDVREDSSEDQSTKSTREDMEEIEISERLMVRLPSEDIQKEWNTLKATVDAYIESITKEED